MTGAFLTAGVGAGHSNPSLDKQSDVQNFLSRVGVRQ